VKSFRFNLLAEIDVPEQALDSLHHTVDSQVESADGDNMIGAARRAEELGIDVFCIPDHLYSSHDPLIAAMAAAAATSRLRVAQTMLINDFRHPAQVAKAIASIDRFCGGRAEVGVGAGYNPDEYDRSGVPFDPPSVRVSRLRESLRIIRELLHSDQPVTFKGEFYTLKGLVGHPRPIQQPGPPIWVGGGGPRVLRVAGELADIIDISVRDPLPSTLPRDQWQFTPEALSEKIECIREGAGRRFDELLTGFFPLKVVVTDDREAAARRVHAELDATYRNAHGYPGGFSLSLEQVLESPLFFIGTQDEIANQFVGIRRTFGCTNFVALSGQLEDLTPVIQKLKRDDSALS
jgi:probable F420-dependent oxidoreductase